MGKRLGWFTRGAAQNRQGSGARQGPTTKSYLWAGLASDADEQKSQMMFQPSDKTGWHETHVTHLSIPKLIPDSWGIAIFVPA